MAEPDSQCPDQSHRNTGLDQCRTPFTDDDTHGAGGKYQLFIGFLLEFPCCQGTGIINASHDDSHGYQAGAEKDQRRQVFRQEGIEVGFNSRTCCCDRRDLYFIVVNQACLLDSLPEILGYVIIEVIDLHLYYRSFPSGEAAGNIGYFNNCQHFLRIKYFFSLFMVGGNNFKPGVMLSADAFYYLGELL